MLQYLGNLRRDLVPGGKIGVADDFLRVLGSAEDPSGYAAQQATVFPVSLGNGVLGTLKEQSDDLGIFHGFTPFSEAPGGAFLCCKGLTPI